jgi:hypothetical protein
VSPSGPGGAAKAARTAQLQQARGGANGALLPPQLRGRSNVVTEDLEKMGLKRRGGGAGGRGGGAGARPAAG